MGWQQFPEDMHYNCTSAEMKKLEMEKSFWEKKLGQEKDLFSLPPNHALPKNGKAFPTFAKLPDIKPLTREV